MSRFRQTGNKQLLLADTEQVARALTKKLLTYATGHGVEPTDAPAIERIVVNAKAKNFAFRTLIHELVASEIFQTK